MKLKIDDNMHEIFNPLTAEELDLLTHSILTEGVRDPIVVWSGYIIDGRHRYQIAIEHDIPFDAIEMDFANKHEAIDWMINNQLGKRNLSENDKKDLRGMRYNSEKGKQGGDRRSEEFSKGNSCPLKNSSEQLADQLNVSPRTIKNDGAFSDAVDTIVKNTGIARHEARNIGTAKDIQDIAKKTPEQQKEIVARNANGEAATAAIREVKRAEVKALLEDINTKEAKAIQGIYDVIVIDPPWKMEKIERDVTPEQVGFDYPTMTEEQLADLKIPAADNCHMWLWTTHKHLPVALRLLDAWGFKYVCTFVWHKPGGFQVVGLPQYNCEFAIYARKGTPKFVDTKKFFTCFEAQRGRHSEKPEEFYEVVRRVTAGRRIDMFGRRKIDGFDSWGNESPLCRCAEAMLGHPK